MLLLMKFHGRCLRNISVCVHRFLAGPFSRSTLLTVVNLDAVLRVSIHARLGQIERLQFGVE